MHRCANHRRGHVPYCLLWQPRRWRNHILGIKRSTIYFSSKWSCFFPQDLTKGSSHRLSSLGRHGRCRKSGYLACSCVQLMQLSRFLFHAQRLAYEHVDLSCVRGSCQPDPSLPKEYDWEYLRLRLWELHDYVYTKPVNTVSPDERLITKSTRKTIHWHLEAGKYFGKWHRYI